MVNHTSDYSLMTFDRMSYFHALYIRNVPKLEIIGHKLTQLGRNMCYG